MGEKPQREFCNHFQVIHETSHFQVSSSFFEYSNRSAFAIFLAGALFLFPSCAMFNSRPLKQMAYAEAAMNAATQANAESNPATTTIYLNGRDQLARARSYYKMKNFKMARLYANKARMAAEEAEWKAQKSTHDAAPIQVEAPAK